LHIYDSFKAGTSFKYLLCNSGARTSVAYSAPIPRRRRESSER